MQRTTFLGLITSCCGLTFSPLASAQSALHVLDLLNGPGGKLNAVENIGDLDADGIADIALASNLETVGANQSAGRIRVRSGATGAVLLELSGANSNEVLGRALAAAGDIDADGRPDLLAAAYDSALQSHVVRAFSGANGAILRTILVKPGALEGGRDVNGDSVPDILVVRRLPASPFAIGEVDVYSGASGVLLFSYSSPALGEFDGEDPAPWSIANYRVTWLEDLNGNGSPEIALGAAAAYGPNGLTGMIRVIDGATGAVLRDAYPSQLLGMRYGTWIENVGDIDEDGLDDLAVRYFVGTSSCTQMFSTVDIVSIASGAILHTWKGNQPNCDGWGGDAFGMAIAGVGDVDGDGRNDVLVGSMASHLNSTSPTGAAQLHSGRTGQVLAVLLPWSSYPDAYFGSFVSAMGDLDGDGRGDFAITSSTFDTPTLANPFVGRLSLYSGAPDSIVSFGASCPAFGQGPTLSAATGNPNSLSIQITNANPNAPGVLAIGTLPLWPQGGAFGSCIALQVQPLLLVLSFSVGGGGTYAIQASLPPSLQMSFSLQALIYTPGLIGNVASTNGLQFAIH